ncbi:Protein of unknown function [Pyronema omphalodes CBS 100304]|uniref:Uncharacterized protein n=1 Tax=Pyronema omphalodes (strain CBS 100304) TaxID=1076935 RepID=U4LKT5_PYROM|nr:Protein of unknown function [Pyronema omphalodes CBS 100304]
MQFSSIIFTSFFAISLSLSLPEANRNATSAKLAPIRSIIGDKVQLQVCKRVAPQPDMMYASFCADMYPALETCVNLDNGAVHSMGGPMAAFDNSISHYSISGGCCRFYADFDCKNFIDAKANMRGNNPAGEGSNGKVMSLKCFKSEVLS